MIVSTVDGTGEEVQLGIRGFCSRVLSALLLLVLGAWAWAWAWACEEEGVEAHKDGEGPHGPNEKLRPDRHDGSHEHECQERGEAPHAVLQALLLLLLLHSTRRRRSSSRG
jgi:ABC-type nickel/cobalt efflux system permease component RcnA